MLKGNNSINLNESTVIAALQYYFDKVLFAEGQSPTVTSVAVNSSKYDAREFTVQLKESAQGTETEKGLTL